MFEQSLLLNDGTKKPWNFLASLSAELLIVSLALLIPLLYHDHLPTVRWKDVIVGPPPSPPPVDVVPAHQTHVTSSAPTLRVVRPITFAPASIPHASQPLSTDVNPDAPPALVTGGVPGGTGGATNMLGRFIPNVVALPPPPPKPMEKRPASTPVAVGGDVQMALLIRKIIPEYPPLAKSARISGVVRLIGTIAKDGTIQNLRLVSGHPLLARAAIEAVRQWVYKPTFLNGQPVEVIAPIEVNFTLGQ